MNKGRFRLGEKLVMATGTNSLPASMGSGVVAAVVLVAMVVVVVVVVVVFVVFVVVVWAAEEEEGVDCGWSCGGMAVEGWRCIDGKWRETREKTSHVHE